MCKCTDEKKESVSINIENGGEVGIQTHCLSTATWNANIESLCEVIGQEGVTSHTFLQVDGDSNVDGDSVIGGDLVHQGSMAGFFNGTPVGKPSALTAPNTSTVDVLYTTQERDVIINMRTRIAELESKLQSLGLIS